MYNGPWDTKSGNVPTLTAQFAASFQEIDGSAQGLARQSSGRPKATGTDAVVCAVPATIRLAAGKGSTGGPPSQLI